MTEADAALTGVAALGAAGVAAIVTTLTPAAAARTIDGAGSDILDFTLFGNRVVPASVQAQAGDLLGVLWACGFLWAWGCPWPVIGYS
ncbi:hypothetical protein [Pseudomonas sp. 6D_7.1_Bac1]|jgi:hypothetical protein|uniref:hypothetical protein n=1 Tax=Pseudomonas sp. 6D_7.1_Bac1 TaxID=2971615 RepID=UPI0021C8050B|nr:hypothetical protein [Pseudomonas sp. 6D_7.1_Bac1]MCU1751970.1 hypothetical protein [Pseudomonas sp. 6D_7.1_Bac1]